MKISRVLGLFAGLASIAYGVLILGLHTGASTYLIWFGLGGTVILVTELKARGVWKRIRKPVRRGIRAVFALGLASFILVEGCILSGCFRKGEPGLDAVIVLGAQMTAKGPSPVLRYRLDRAYEYLMENEQTICIVSGGQGANEPVSEAQGMKEYLCSRGIPENRILMEDESATTMQNLINSRKILEEETGFSGEEAIGIVTSNFHIFRGVRLARYAGFANAEGIAAKTHPVYFVHNCTREYFGVLKNLPWILKSGK